MSWGRYLKVIVSSDQLSLSQNDLKQKGLQESINTGVSWVFICVLFNYMSVDKWGEAIAILWNNLLEKLLLNNEGERNKWEEIGLWWTINTSGIFHDFEVLNESLFLSFILFHVCFAVASSCNMFIYYCVGSVNATVFQKEPLPAYSSEIKNTVSKKDPLVFDLLSINC